MNKPAISVIIPAYNAQDNIRCCLDSILSQSFTDFEVIVVDDGSTDDTLDICLEYEDRDRRVKVLHKENEGVAAARQSGIGLVSGKYTIHADSDDFMDSSMLEDMYRCAKKDGADIVFCDYFLTEKDGTGFNDRYVSQDIGSVDSGALICADIEGRLFGSLWNKLVRTSLFRENGIGFDRMITYSEDSFFLIRLLLRSNRNSYLPKAYYHYVCQKNSISRGISRNILDERLYYVSSVDSLIEKAFKNGFSILYPYSDDIRKALIDLKFRNLSRALHSGLYEISQIKDTFPEVMKTKYILHCGMKFSDKLRFLLINLF